MELYEAIRTRASVRKYRPDPIPEDVRERVLEAMRLAPSAGNKQPWRFILVEDADLRPQVAQACNGQAWMADAAVIVVACGREADAYGGMGGYWNSLDVDVAIALDHLTLAAAAEGLGTCWIGSFKEAEVRKLLGIPDDVKVVALTPLGYPAVAPEQAPRKPRKPLAEIISHDRWER